ncbi:MAG: transporter, periplasmic substrate-binding protein [Nitrospirae bacterium]|nr:transporter, periplasmic substrate-binding protein [Nitrospirota bacterium]
MKKVSIKIRRLILSLLVISMILNSGSVIAAEKTIGVILIPNIPYYEDIHKAFTETLLSEAIAEKKASSSNILEAEIIIQKPLPDPISLMNTARKFAAVGADIIVSYGAPSALAAVGEQSSIPVVFAGVYDPRGVGMSLKNATGVSSKVSVATLLKKLKSISNFSKLGVLYSDTEKDTVLQSEEVKKLEESMGFKSVMLNIKRAQDIAKITGVDALLITTSCPTQYCLSNITDIARKSNIPTATLTGTEEDKGVILTIIANPQEQGREAAKMVVKLLKGAKASSLPVVEPSKVDMIINLKEASSMGLKVPFDLLSSATKIIK